MLEISNSRILIDDISCIFTDSYPNRTQINAPVVRFSFYLSPKQGVTDFSGIVNIRNIKYAFASRSSNSTSEYIMPENWYDLCSNSDDVNRMIGNSTISITWSGRNDRKYLYASINTSDTSTPTRTQNHITFKLKNLDAFKDIDNDTQLCVRMEFEEGGGLSQYPYSGMCTVADSNSNSEILFRTTDGNGANIPIKTTNPYAGNLKENKDYINSPSFNVKVINYSYDAEFFAYRVNDGAISEWAEIEFIDGSNYIELPINLGADAVDGNYRVKIYVRDRYFNYTSDDNNCVIFDTVKVSLNPYDCKFEIYGQGGNSRYAGINIQEDGSFVPNREVSLVFFGNSLLPLNCRIYSNDKEVVIPKITSTVSGDNLEINVGNINELAANSEHLDISDSNCDTGTFLYKNTYGEDKDRKINEIKCVLVGSDYNMSSDRSVTIVFTDIAGNETTITKDIKLNNRIFKCNKKNLRNETSDYAHVLMKENSYGTYDTVSRAAVGKEDDFKRMWEDIYFPEKQGPKMNGNEIDMDWARVAYKQYVDSGNKFAYNSSDDYGLFMMELDSDNVYQPVYDEEKRVTSIWNTSKTYSPYVSRNKSDMWFRVIDNYGQGDITLEFERFDMSSNPGDMANATSGGYKGDVVMIYNAENKDCLTEVKNPDGTTSYPTDGVNTVLMELLAVYSGTPGSVYDWLSGSSIKSNDTTGAFEATFPCTRICVIVCTDSSKEKSGFKIKAGKKIGLTYSNYDVDEINGEVWYHGESDNWGSTDKKIRMFYDYYDSSVSFNYDKGFVIMNTSDLPSNSVVTCDYSYYKNKSDYNEEDNVWLRGDAGTSDGNFTENYRLYIASDDDLYEYLQPTVYVTPIGERINKDGVIYSPIGTKFGKFTDSYWSIDKDRGLIQINRYNDNNPDYYVPFNDNGYPMRITMDYTHHTFYRLSNDGYGNVRFEDKVIVADSTPVYPDATWADIRIVNEGSAILESGKLIFKCRGEADGDSDDVKKPLDVNRPWDIQEGKKDVTWDRCRIYLSHTFDENYFQFTPSISDLRRTYNAAGGNNASLTVSSSEPYLAPKESLYGRIVWNLAGDTGSKLNNAKYPTDGLTLGRKSWSAEISGRYYVVED